MRAKCLEIEGLRQRLYDPSRAERFTVYVEQVLTFYSGDFVALVGPSGCGKTTLLSVLGLLRAPSAPAELARFTLSIPARGGGQEALDLRSAWLRRKTRLIESVRRRYMGFALQAGELVTSLTVRENVAAPLYLNGVPRGDRRDRVDYLIDAFGLRRRIGGDMPDQSAAADGRFISLARSRVNKLSGGEYQRVALARSVAHRPIVNFVDEPTSSLNRELARGALQVLATVQHGQHPKGVAVMITHDEQLANEFCNVTVRMAPRHDEPAGEVVEILRRDNPQSALTGDVRD